MCLLISAMHNRVHRVKVCNSGVILNHGNLKDIVIVTGAMISEHTQRMFLRCICIEYQRLNIIKNGQIDVKPGMQVAWVHLR